MIWKDGAVPYSREFQDVYYSTVDAAAERRHVFLSGIGAPECWAGRSEYVIAETGFGAGLTFLLACRLWQQTRGAAARLFYIAVENAPLSCSDLLKAHAPYPELAPLSAQLRAAYPVRHPGYHQILLDGGRIELLLLFGAAEEMLAGLSATADAWFLDGFAPNRNPGMWSPRVFSAIAERSKKQTRLATYTTARAVQDGLRQAGFDCRKVAGFAGKRESLSGVKSADDPAPRRAPWYRRSAPLRRGASVAVIGAGISGACMGAALQRAGADVTVIDSHAGPAGEASGNPGGLIQPRPGGGNAAYERLQTGAYFHALRAYDAIPDGHDFWIGERGVLSFARDDAFLSRHRDWLSAGGLPDAHGRAVDKGAVDDIAGIKIGMAATWFPEAGTLNPGLICRALLASLPTRYGLTINKIVACDGGWALLDADQHQHLVVDAVVLANGHAASQLCPDGPIPLYAKRGQISYMRASTASSALRVGLSYGGYATPALQEAGNKSHILGATYQQWTDFESKAWQQLQDADHAENQNLVGARLPALAAILAGPITGGRATLRTTTTDHLPVVGPAFNTAAYQRDYGDLRHGRPPGSYPDAGYTAGVYVLSALGSRGFALAPLLASVLVAEMAGTPLPVDETVHNLVHPARFLVRQLKRG
ncbi:MAG: bifunctional tRNA (5-methylaminomethyl-2-thiouridine)(34)-methyltransferase MnmD/FAD-dependent 5-carboxymethylaminomethyl-2-thiouridine(34) oxidoreductase MnmC [Rhodospirillales bacterium]|nr:bifunctional tRNA (5-methylaminomethyl-2-thiouridine)(34)-methyltransferase MnmD/FAD-dependent 5-carboxymethylaminomethyl-2-thiouridine(34) oxidoreductase MnmC [Rhodospirillales bacterium]